MQPHRKSQLAAVAFLLIATPVLAAWEAIEDFESHPPGAVSKSAKLLSGGDGAVYDIVSEAEGRFLRSSRSSSNWRYWWTALALPRVIPPESAGATLTLRFRYKPVANGLLDLSFGITCGSPSENADFMLYRVQAAPDIRKEGLALRLRTGADLLDGVVGLPPDTWFRAWFVIDNRSGLYRFYLANGDEDATEEHRLGSDLRFRPSQPADGPLTHFTVMRASKDGTTAFDIDDLWIDYQGTNLANPNSKSKDHPHALAR